MAFLKDQGICLTYRSEKYYGDANYLFDQFEHKKNVIATGQIESEIFHRAGGMKFFFIDEENNLFKFFASNRGEIIREHILPESKVIDYTESSYGKSAAITIDGLLLVKNETMGPFARVLPEHKFVKTYALGNCIFALDKEGNLWGNRHSIRDLFGENPSTEFTQITNDMDIVGFHFSESESTMRRFLIAQSGSGKLYFFTNPEVYEPGKIHPVVGEVVKKPSPIYEINLDGIEIRKCLVTRKKLFILDQSNNLWNISLSTYMAKPLKLKIVEQDIKSIVALVFNSYNLVLALSNDGHVKEIFEDLGVEDPLTLVRNASDYDNFEVDSLPGDYSDLPQKRFNKTKSANKNFIPN